MVMRAPCLSISATTLTTPSSSHRLQPHTPSHTLSFNYPSSTIRLSNLKTPITPSFLSHHFLQFRPYAATIDTFEDSQSEEEEFFDEDEEEEQEVGLETPVAAEGSRLYVGNLPFAMTSAQLKDIFGEAGRIASVEIVYDRVTDRSRGFAFVTMQSVDEAKEAIRMFNGAQIGGRSVKVNFPEVPRGGESQVMGPRIRSSYTGFINSPYKIYAGNLSWKLTSQALRDAFNDQPGLLSAKVIYERDSGRSRGYGFITFASMNEAQSALMALNGVEVEGRPLRLNLAAENSSTSEPQETSSDSGSAQPNGVEI